MNYAARMGFRYPETAAERRAGMSAMLKRARNAHQRHAHDHTLSRKERLWQRELAAQADAAIAKLQEST